MSLEERINDQYSKRKSKATLYQGGSYVDAVTKEIREGISIMLHQQFDNFTDLTLLEIGAGNGTNAYIFESMGFKRPNISFNELLKERIEAIKSNFPQNSVFEGDATVVPIDKTFDVIFQSTVFSSILHQSDREKLAERLWSLLKPGGIILWYDFIYNNPSNKDVRKVTQKELKQLFPLRSQYISKKITLAPPIGRRVARFYKLFNVPLLRSHVLVTIKK